MKNAVLDFIYTVIRFLAIFVSFALLNAIILQFVKDVLTAWK